MAQKLILPINKAKLTASMKTAAYLKKFGFVHYGIDMVSTHGDRTIYASGDGVVLATGFDNVVGNVVAVHYPAAYNRTTKKTEDVVFRYFHLEKILVAKGAKLDKDSKIGIYGNTGMLNMANHLHIEADTDVNYPLYSPTVSRSNLIWGRSQGAHDKSMSDPLEWMHCKSTAPDHQTYCTAGDSYIAGGNARVSEY